MYHRPEKKKQTLGFPICLLLFFIEILEAEYNFNKVEKGAINNKRRAFFYDTTRCVRKQILL